MFENMFEKAIKLEKSRKCHMPDKKSSTMMTARPPWPVNEQPFSCYKLRNTFLLYSSMSITTTKNQLEKTYLPCAVLQTNFNQFCLFSNWIYNVSFFQIGSILWVFFKLDLKCEFFSNWIYIVSFFRIGSML